MSPTALAIRCITTQETGLQRVLCCSCAYHLCEHEETVGHETAPILEKNDILLPRCRRICDSPEGWRLRRPSLLLSRFTLSNPLVASAVVGATSRCQLEEIAAAAALGPLSDDILETINQIHQQYPNPNP